MQRIMVYATAQEHWESYPEELGPHNVFNIVFPGGGGGGCKIYRLSNKKVKLIVYWRHFSTRFFTKVGKNPNNMV